MPHVTVPEDPIRLPATPADPPRAAFPLWAALVPVFGALVLWQITGSATMLWFAALGPLVALATRLDARRGRRRTRRRAADEGAAALAQARDEVARRHEAERRALWRTHPDVARYLARPDDIWRPAPGRASVLVVGAGQERSSVRVEPGEGEAARELRRRAGVLDDAPVRVPLEAGVAVIGPPAAAAAVVRALALQVLLALPPGQARALGGEEWMSRTPHARATRGLRVWAGDSGAPVPAEADIPVVHVVDAVAPPRCAAVLRLLAGGTAVLEHDGVAREVRPEPASVDRALAIAEALTARGRSVGAAPTETAPFAALAAAPGGGLRVGIGADRAGLVSVDLLEDGPHAVVIGVTGSGKSELLITWVAAMAARYAPTEVTFLLVDFKGGRAFDPLRPLAHVVGMVTDLDAETTRRAIDSLSAEIRHRERVLGEHGVRDVAELGGVLPRLVIVVDEYAAMTAAHPAFHDVFADIAARGRALGMHLILATQRAAGFRDAVLANAPLRIALRVTDPADSRAILGCIDAAALPGGLADRGSALVRRGSDADARPMRVALCPPSEIDAIAEAARAAGPVRRPWLPALPHRIALADLRVPGRVVLGVADEPESQRQRTVLLEGGVPGLAVLGRSGSGRSSVLRAVAAQVAPERLFLVPVDPEAAWDAIAHLDDASTDDVIVIDDLDLIIGRFPPDYAAVAVEALERTAREARGRGIRLIVSAQRLGAAVGRIVDQLPARAILATASRADQVAFGGDAAHHDPRLPPGRGRLGGVLVQFADPGGRGAAQAQGAGASPAGTAAAGTAPAGTEPARTEPARTGAGAEADDPGGSRRARRGEARPAAARQHGAGGWIPERPTGFVVGPGRAPHDALAAWRAAGIDTVPIEAAAGGLARGRVVWGSPDQWVGRWRSLAAGAADAELVVDASCAAEVRLITGRRDLPPYAVSGARRAWLFDVDGQARRIRLPRPGPTAGGARARS